MILDSCLSTCVCCSLVVFYEKRDDFYLRIELFSFGFGFKDICAVILCVISMMLR